MSNVVRLVINDRPQDLTLKEYQGQRVVTFRDIDELHDRPEGTARRNFNENKHRFIEGTDFFVRNSHEAKVEFGIIAPNGLALITESGYLMLVKSFTDDLAWEVQRVLVNSYFRVKELQPLLPIHGGLTPDQIAAIGYAIAATGEELKAARAEIQRLQEQTTVLQHRVANLDLTNIEGTPRQRLVQMIKRYAHQNGITFPLAWHHFDTAFNTAYRTNLTARRKNYSRMNGLRNIVDRPEFLDVHGLIPDAIRVADKMLNSKEQAG